MHQRGTAAGMPAKLTRRDRNLTNARPLQSQGNAKEVVMKFLITAIAAASMAAITAVAASTDPTDLGAARSISAAATSVEPAPLLLAGPYGQCTEDLGYGRTGSYGCG
jgi:hypothetical protein